MAGEENRAGVFLVVYMRLLAGLWVIQGLLQWSAILLPPEPVLDEVSALRGAAVIFFAIFDLVAAVGLWLAAPWGGVIWLLGAIAQIFVALGAAGVLFDALGRRRYCLDRDLFRLDVAGGPRGLAARSVAQALIRASVDG